MRLVRLACVVLFALALPAMATEPSKRDLLMKMFAAMRLTVPANAPQVSTFERHLSESDIKAITAFYATQAGRHLAAANEDITQEALRDLKARTEQSRQRRTTPPESTRSSGRPSEDEVRTCVSKTLMETGTGHSYGQVYGSVIEVQFGTPITSASGSSVELMGVPTGENLFPVKIRFPRNYAFEFWVWRDSFGVLKCRRSG